MTDVHVERGVALAAENGCAAWTFEPAHWGRCGQGPDEAAAVADLARQLGTAPPPVVVEVIDGDERAFARDRRPCTDGERAATLRILAAARRRTLALVRSAPAAVLDWDDPERELPGWARWRTPRQLAWHIADTESRYYLPRTGLAARPRAGDLVTELTASRRHVRSVLTAMPPDAAVETDETWTSTKLLRRLAWHERSELAVLESLVARAGRRAGGPGQPGAGR